jgi:hypothetical protein
MSLAANCPQTIIKFHNTFSNHQAPLTISWSTFTFTYSQIIDISFIIAFIHPHTDLFQTKAHLIPVAIAFQFNPTRKVIFLKENIMSRKTLFILTLLIIFPMLTSLACLSSVREKISGKVSDFVEEEVGEALEDVVGGIVPEDIIPTEEGAPPVVEPTVEQAPVEPPTEVETPVEEVPAEGEPKEIILLDKSKWIQDEDTVFVAYQFQNPNLSYMFEDAKFSFRFLDSTSAEIGFDEYYVAQIFPEEKISIVFTYYLPDAETIVDSVTTEWEITSIVPAQGMVNPLSTSTVKFWPSGGYPIVTGSIANNSSSILTTIQTNIVCYNGAGEIVGGGLAYIDFVPNNAQVGFSNYVETFDTVATVEVYPFMSYGSNTVDDPNAWTKLAVVDNYFYQGTYSWGYGGVIIRNQTADVLKNSMFYATFFDDDGNVVSVASSYFDVLLPGEELGFSPWIYSLPDGARMSTFEAWAFPGEAITNYELTSNPFVVNSTEVVGDFQDTVLVNFTNTYTKQVSEVEIFVLLRNAQGLIIGGGNDWTDEPTPAGGTTAAEIYVTKDSSETIASIEAWVVPSYWTTFE